MKWRRQRPYKKNDGRAARRRTKRIGARHPDALTNGKVGFIERFTIYKSDAPALTSGNIMDFIIKCGAVLDEQNVPTEGRWLQISPSMSMMFRDKRQYRTMMRRMKRTVIER